MGSGASIVDLSSTELGEAVSKLGKHYELASKEIIDSGISGTILFQTVHDSEEQFKSFVAEHFNITKPLLQTVLFTSYAGLLQNDGSSGKSIASLYDIKETLQRSPRQIVTDLFQIQGIKLDPENVAGAVDDIAAAIHASIGEDTICDGINTFHCFIGYRVLADKIVAELLYDKLTIKGLKPFLDKFKLKNGLPWKDGFLQGLKGSKCFVSLISSRALSLCRDMNINHTWDNYLLEIETALQYMHATGNAAYIVPIHIGEMVTVDGRTMLLKFSDFASSLYADTIEGSAVPSHLDSLKEVVHSAYSIPILAGEMVTIEGKSILVEGKNMLGKLGNFAGQLYADKVGRLAALSHDNQEQPHAAEINDAALTGESVMEMKDATVNDLAVQAVAKHKQKPTKTDATSPDPSNRKEATSWWKKDSPGRQKMDAIIEQERAKQLEKTKQLVKEKYNVSDA